jgi:hypothetical protein
VPALRDVGTDPDATGRGTAAIVERRGSLARPWVADGADDTSGDGDDEGDDRAGEQTTAWHRVNHRQFARRAQTTGFVTGRTGFVTERGRLGRRRRRERALA